ncbi:MAG: choice-of-anchor L domain-containing protein [Limnohabitans sp.]|nr:choice-of-anchor L domain-containing protein [Limnohabitans sp.]
MEKFVKYNLFINFIKIDVFVPTFNTYDPLTDPTGQALIQSLLSPTSGISIEAGSVVLSASGPSAVSLYDGSLSLGIGAGLLLTSGMVPGTSNTVGWFGQDNTNWNQLDSSGMPLNFFNGDAAIDAVVNTVFQTQSFDATKLGFNFTTAADATSISFDVVFGSDEFPEWVDQFVDCAVVIVNGVNYALFNHDPNAPLSVIGSNLAAGYFQDNAGNVLPIEYDGVSHVLKIVAPIKSGEVNSIMIGIADTGDHIYDSGIFISNFSAGNTPGSGVVITPDVPCTEGADVVTGSVADELIKLLGGDDTAYAGGGDDIVMAGGGNDKVYGGSGNDVLEGDAGDDYLDGGEGLANQAVYAGKSSDYAVNYDAVSDTYSLTGSEGSDTLKAIQQLKFSDGLFDLKQDGLHLHAVDTGNPGNQPGSVVVSGAGMVGQTLSAVVFDPDGLSTSVVTYDWQTSTDGLTWTSTGNSSKTYTVTADNAGLQVIVNVAYTDMAGGPESLTSEPLTVAAKTGLAISLVQLSSPAGAGVQNPLTTLLSHAIELGFSANEATLAIKTVLGLPDINLKTYDPLAILGVNPADITALKVLKICGELAMAASASDPSVFNLTLAVMDAASQGLTINLGNKIQIGTLLTGIGPAELDIVQTTCKDMADASTFAKVMAAWNDFCGNTDGMELYQDSFSHFNIDLNQSPDGNCTAVLPFATIDTPYTIAVADLLLGFSDPDGDTLAIADLTPDAGGTFSDNGDGTWTFTPDTGFTGPVELSFTVHDGNVSTTGHTIFVVAAAEPPPAQDSTAPTVTSVDYGINDGTLKAGETVSLVVTLSESVNISGAPSIALSNGAIASYTGGTGTNILTFSYTVAAGENSADLATALNNALSGGIADAAGNALADTDLDGINPLGSVVVDTTAPTVVSVAYGSNDGTLKAGDSVSLVITLSESATVSGTPTIALSNLGTASYTSGSSTNTLTCSYTAAYGQDTADLATALTDSLNGIIADLAGNNVIAAGFNAMNPTGTLVVDTIAPTVTAFSPADGASLVAVGSNIVLTMTEALARGTGSISLYSGSPTGTLVESFDAALSNRISITNSTLTLDPTNNLTNNTRYFVVFGNGAVRDLAGNAYAGTNTYDFMTTPAGNPITGTVNADALNGTAGVDLISGWGGNDTMTGAGGTDLMDGGEGSDLYIVAATADHGAAEFNDSGLVGTDEVRFTSAVANSTLTLYAGDLGIEKVVIGTGTAATAVSTGKTALNVNASALTYGIALAGNAGANKLTGGLGNDTLTGNAGIDTFNVTAGTDTIADVGNGGADVLNVSLGATANATVTTSWTASAATVNKGVVNLSSNGLAVNLAAITATTAGNLGYHVTNTGTATTLTGSSLGDWLTGAAGNDTLVGGAGVDALNGGAGSDLYIVAATADHGAAEFNDSGLVGADEVRFTSAVANSTLTLYAGDLGIEKVVIGTGTAAAAVSTATTALNVNASAMSYGITLVGNAGANALTGGTGNDTLQGGAGNDVLNGGNGFDYSDYTSATKAIAVNLGLITAPNTGGAGTDTLTGIEGVLGGSAADTLTGDANANILVGNAGNDVLNGAAGFDQLKGGNGNDTLTGGAGIDWFIFDVAANGTTNKDTVNDFASGVDVLQLSRAIFTGLSAAPLGALGIDAFWSGANVNAAHDATDRLIYNNTTGALYYDADGTGASTAVQVAVLGTTLHPVLTYTDFAVIG